MLDDRGKNRIKFVLVIVLLIEMWMIYAVTNGTYDRDTVIDPQIQFGPTSP